MSPTAHRIYVSTLVGILIVSTILIIFYGFHYYSTAHVERFYHPDHDYLKPSGEVGHGLGILGTLIIVIGVFGYMARKRYRSLARLGRLKYWLEFHIFLCSLGSIMILFHTAFKFGGIVSIAFWSMVAVVGSGVIGRFIYIQIPRSIEGRELSLNEVKAMKTNIGEVLIKNYHLESEIFQPILNYTEQSSMSNSGNLFQQMFNKYMKDRNEIGSFKNTLHSRNIKRKEVRGIVKLIKNEIALNNRISRLLVMQSLFKGWHIVHLPFAIIMLVIVVVHVAITLAFGYTWIF